MTTASSAIDAGTQKKIQGSGMATLISQWKDKWFGENH